MKTAHPLMSVTGGLEGVVLEVLTGTTSALALGEVHGLAGAASKSGIRKALLRLVDGGIVEVVPGGYLLNRDHLASGAIIELAQLRRALFERIAQDIHSWKPSVVLAGVFGSVARGEGDDHSDIDVLVVADSFHENAVGELAGRVRRWTGNDCHVVALTPREFEKAVRSREAIVSSWRNDLVVLVGDRALLDAGRR